MSQAKQDKEYQLWVHYSLQNADNPQKGYELALETDELDELYIASMKLDKHDKYYLTKSITLRVQAM